MHNDELPAEPPKRAFAFRFSWLQRHTSHSASVSATCKADQPAGCPSSDLARSLFGVIIFLRPLQELPLNSLGSKPLLDSTAAQDPDALLVRKDPFHRGLDALHEVRDCLIGIDIHSENRALR